MNRAASFIPRQLRARPLACFAVAFLLGVMLGLRFRVPTPATALALVSIVGIACTLRKRKSVIWMLLLIGLLAGVTRVSMALDMAQPVETRYSVTMEGRVTSEPFTNAKTGRRICRFRADTVNGESSGLKLRLYLRGEEAPLEAIAYGQSLTLKGHIWASDPVTNPYEFDFGAYLRRQGFDAYATAKIEDVSISGETRDLHSVLIDVRQALSRRIDALFPENAGMMRALVLGDRSMLGDELRESLNRTGTGHLISISGMHVSVLAMLIAAVLARFMSRRRANLIAVALLIPYGLLIGFTAPFFRALVTFALLSFAPVAGYPNDDVTRLCAAMLLWLWVNPLSVEDAGFALSFSASAGILLLTPPMRRALGIEALLRKKPSPKRSARVLRRAALFIPTLLCASLAAQLATLPCVLAYFGVQSIVSLPYNLVCVPLCMLGYILGLISLLVSAVSLPVAALLARLPDAVLTLMLAVTRHSLSLPVATVHIGRYPPALLALQWTVLLWASDLSKTRFSVRRFLPLALLGVAALSTLCVFLRAWDFSVTFLDAGQADCAVVCFRGHTYLFDTGDTYTPASDYLNATCLRLDGVVLSHPHEDHAGGLSDILDSFRPGFIYVPRGWFEVEDVSPAVVEGIDKARRMGVEIRKLSAGDALTLPSGATMEVFSPTVDALLDEINDMSLLTLVTFDGQRALFTGDLSMDGEPEAIPDTDILKVAHHGSDKATSERFLEAATPQYAVISVGENNYGHPGEETLRKLNACGAQVFQTRQWGAITLTWKDGAWRTDTYQEAPNEVE